MQHCVPSVKFLHIPDENKVKTKYVSERILYYSFKRFTLQRPDLFSSRSEPITKAVANIP